jgi:hypothetical protein
MTSVRRQVDDGEVGLTGVGGGGIGDGRVGGVGDGRAGDGGVGTRGVGDDWTSRSHVTEDEPKKERMLSADEAPKPSRPEESLGCMM